MDFPVKYDFAFENFDFLFETKEWGNSNKETKNTRVAGTNTFPKRRNEIISLVLQLQSSTSTPDSYSKDVDLRGLGSNYRSCLNGTRCSERK